MVLIFTEKGAFGCLLFWGAVSLIMAIMAASIVYAGKYYKIKIEVSNNIVGLYVCIVLYVRMHH